jgi:Subtilisin inhibitor-like
MRAAVFLALVALAATGCMGRSTSGSPSVETTKANLEISVTPAGDGPTKLWTLRCGPTGGTLPHPAEACTRLSRLDDPFAPVPKKVACTAIYGGPQTAEIHGTFRGKKVDATFSRGDGCEIERWDRVAFLFPGT